MAALENAISIKNISISTEGHIILENVNLELEEGDFLGLIGPNGGGKSSLLKVILGLIKPDRGEVNIFGLTPEQARKYVGYLPQKTLFDLNFPVNALDVVLMGRYSRRGLLRHLTGEDKSAALSALEAVGMKDHAFRQIGSLSGGEQQRIFVARSIVSQPRLLLLDEPTAGVDVAQECGFYDLLSQLNKVKKMTIVLVSHDVTAVSRYVNKIACLNQRIYYHGSKQLPAEEIEKAYGCPIDMIAHGIPHRVLRKHA
ncbi:MAG: ABC transporter ATP-binding protein [Methanotrichaceae archaeon]|nr:ABC transporter ATP-binding protein [Methanotrichaceae archaeon]